MIARALNGPGAGEITPLCGGTNGICPGVNGACPGINGACPEIKRFLSRPVENSSTLAG